MRERAFDTGLIIPRPPAATLSSRFTEYRRRYVPDRESNRRMRRHLAGRYNVKAKWEKLLAEKEASWVSFIRCVFLVLFCNTAAATVEIPRLGL